MTTIGVLFCNNIQNLESTNKQFKATLYMDDKSCIFLSSIDQSCDAYEYLIANTTCLIVKRKNSTTFVSIKNIVKILVTENENTTVENESTNTPQAEVNLL